MPQSLTVSGGSSGGSSIKRQRSADSRETQNRLISSDRNRSNGSLSKSTIRIPRYLDKSRGDIAQAFQDLEWKQRFRLFHALENPDTSPYWVDRSEIVISRNRYGNVQPWDNSRVKLKVPIDGSDYVNASPITLKSRGPVRTGDDRSEIGSQRTFQESRYISTQGPKDITVAHFWYMVMQETVGDTGVVVMLTQCYEANKEKCSAYFPTSINNPTIVLSSSDRNEEDKENIDEENPPEPDPVSHNTVTLKSITDDVRTSSQLRILSLTVGNQTKTIYHYLFHGWPDFGKPEAEDRVALLELTRQTKKVAGDSPRIVHCSAGVGRTGTFIALDFLIREVEEGRLADIVVQSDDCTSARTSIYRDDITPTGETWGKSGPLKVKTPTGGEFPSGEENHAMKNDLIYDTVNTLREQRMMMVMNELQYSFLYEVVREVFLEKYRARAEGAVVKGAEDGAVESRMAKVARVEGDGGGEDVDGDHGSASEAETEIMEGESEKVVEAKVKTAEEGDPYNVVAPEHIRAGLARQNSSQIGK